MDEKLAAVVTVTPQALARLLHLPDGAEIDAAWSPADQPGVLKLRVRGVGERYYPGQVLFQAPAGVIICNDAGQVVSVDWGFPRS